MVVLLVDQEARAKRKQCVECRECVILRRGEACIENQNTEVFDINVNGVEKEQSFVVSKAGNVVEDCRHIHEKRAEYAPEIVNVAEEHEERREDQSNSKAENNEPEGRNDEREEIERKGNLINDAEQKEDDKGESKVDQRGDRLGEEEQILGHVDLGEDLGVVQERSHSAARCVTKEGEHDVTAKQEGGVMCDGRTKEIGKDDAHNKQVEQRREKTPKHTQIGALVFFLKITLYKLGEQKTVFL